MMVLRGEDVGGVTQRHERRWDVGIVTTELHGVGVLRGEDVANDDG